MFKSYISLGWFCGTAASMSKYGLRGFSGPFDWYFSDFSGVIQTIETDFIDFLAEANLVNTEEKPLEFDDIKYGFHFCHEIKNGYSQDIESVREKYLRRIEKFRSELKSGDVCFIRAVRDQKELDYIYGNRSRIYTVLGIDNNAIIYLIPEYLNIPTDLKEIYYVLPINGYHGNSQEILRELFDLNEDFVSFCIKNLSYTNYKSNLLFDMQAETRRTAINACRYSNLRLIMNTDYSKLKTNKKIDIYGAGNIGKVLFDKIKGRVTVGCFIDSSPANDYYDDIPIIEMSKYVYVDGTYIVVTPNYEYYKICSDLKVM